MARGTQVMKIGSKKRKNQSRWSANASKRRRLVANNTRSLVTWSDYGFPERIGTKLRYVENLYLTSNTSNTFRLNSLFDPNLTGVGHQPMYHDQFSLIYGKYRVKGAKITVKFTSNQAPATAASNSSPCFVGIVCSSSSSMVSTGIEQRSEEDANSVKILQDKTGGNNVVTCYQTFSPKRDLGLSFDDDSLVASTSNNPASVYYAHVWIEDVVDTTPAVVVNVTIEYNVEYFQRLEQASS